MSRQAVFWLVCLRRKLLGWTRAHFYTEIIEMDNLHKSKFYLFNFINSG